MMTRRSLDWRHGDLLQGQISRAWVAGHIHQRKPVDRVVGWSSRLEMLNQHDL
jgi:hypothetical protein